MSILLKNLGILLTTAIIGSTTTVGYSNDPNSSNPSGNNPTYNIANIDLSNGIINVGNNSISNNNTKLIFASDNNNNQQRSVNNSNNSNINNGTYPFYTVLDIPVNPLQLYNTFLYMQENELDNVQININNYTARPLLDGLLARTPYANNDKLNITQGKLNNLINILTVDNKLFLQHRLYSLMS